MDWIYKVRNVYYAVNGDELFSNSVCMNNLLVNIPKFQEPCAKGEYFEPKNTATNIAISTYTNNAKITTVFAKRKAHVFYFMTSSFTGILRIHIMASSQLGLITQLVRPLNRYRRGRWCESRSSLNLFRFYFRNFLSFEKNCDDLFFC